MGSVEIPNIQRLFTFPQSFSIRNIGLGRGVVRRNVGVTEHKTNLCCVTVYPGLRIWFSYETKIAVEVCFNWLLISDENWSKTTRLHLTKIRRLWPLSQIIMMYPPDFEHALDSIHVCVVEGNPCITIDQTILEKGTERMLQRKAGAENERGT